MLNINVENALPKDKELFYSWSSSADKALFDKDANIIGKYLEELGRRKPLTTNNIVDAARDKSSPIHDLFEWDDTIAAQRWRKKQAQILVGFIEITYIENPNSQRGKGFISVELRDTYDTEGADISTATGRKSPRQYISASEARKDPLSR